MTRPTLLPLPGGVSLLSLALMLAASLVAGGTLVNLNRSAPVPLEDRVSDTVRNHLQQWSPLTDPLITLEDGTQAKASNVYGIDIEGERYYYRPRWEFSADPLSRGEVKEYAVVTILDPGTPWETEVYRRM